MISQLEEHIKHRDYDQAKQVLPLLKSLFHEQNEILITIDQLQVQLEQKDPKSEKGLQQLKQLLVG